MSTSTTPARADGRRNRDRILEAALLSVTENGADFTLDDVARRAGISPATLYRHVTGRRALVSTLFEQHVERAVHPHLEAALAEPDPWRGLRHALEATLATVVQHQGLLHAGHDAGLVTPEMGIRFTETLGGVLTRAQAAGSVRPDVTSADLPVIVVMVVAAHRQRGDWRRYLGLLLDGLTTSTPTAPSEEPT